MSQGSIGERLRSAREKKKISLGDVYAKTKIHTSIIEALEEDRFQEYSLVYIKGFLKIYSQFLGLDTESILQEFIGLYSPKKPEPIAEEFPKQKIDLNWLKFRLNPALIKKILIALTAIVLLTSFVSCLKRRRAKTPAVVEKEKIKEVIPSAVKETKKAKFAKLTVLSKDKCWLQVKLDGKLVYRGIFTKGMSDNWQAEEKIELSVGNAGAIEVEINGEILPSLGRKGQVIKNIVITRNGFSIGKNR
ncbi:MAG: RodZ domain-containing protein [Candidatus Omnitrophota bacterium]